MTFKEIFSHFFFWVNQGLPSHNHWFCQNTETRSHTKLQMSLSMHIGMGHSIMEWGNKQIKEQKEQRGQVAQATGAYLQFLWHEVT